MTSFYQSLYRKWRPQRFSDVVGQEYIVKTLRNAVATNQIAHAYLFAGPRGVGKTTLARIFAKAVNCQNALQGEPDNTCDHCQRITKSNSLDVIEIDGASNRGIDQIRQLREEVHFVPAEIRYKVYIIDEVHMLTNEAFNALLKTLEEPPKHAIFILATTEAHKVPATVLSRCQAFEFKNHPPEQIEKHLGQISRAEGIQADERVLRAIAARARGGMRDAIVILEQLASFKSGGGISENDLYDMMGLASEETVLKFLNALLQKESRTALEVIADLADRGKDLELFVDELIAQTRDSLIQVLNNQKASLNANAATLLQLSSKLLEIKRELSRAWERRILLEVKALELISSLSVPAASSRLGAGLSESLTSSTARAEPPAPAREVPGLAVSRAKPVPPAPGEPGPPSRPETAPTSGVTPPSDQDEEKWKQLLDTVKRERRSTVHAFLLEGQPIETESALRIEYSPEKGFHKEGLEKNRKFLEALVQKFYGAKRLEIGFAEAGEAAAVKPTKKSTAREKAELVQKTFDGEILN
jgi:DNA polymerase-3 subunit gamma/tau